MTTSTLVKVGTVAVAALVAKAAWRAAERRRSGQRGPQDSSDLPDTTAATAAGKPADAFSKDAIQHDLSVGEAN